MLFGQYFRCRGTLRLETVCYFWKPGESPGSAPLAGVRAAPAKLFAHFPAHACPSPSHVGSKPTPHRSSALASCLPLACRCPRGVRLLHPQLRAAIHTGNGGDPCRSGHCPSRFPRPRGTELARNPHCPWPPCHVTLPLSPREVSAFSPAFTR